MDVVSMVLFYAFLHWQVVTYLQPGYVITEHDFFAVTVKELTGLPFTRDIQEIENGNIFVAYFTGVILGAYIITAYIGKAFILKTYMGSTGT